MTKPTSSVAIPGFNPDPSLCQAGEDYFLATSTFEYTPGVPIYHSRDLSNWSLIGHALSRPTQLLLRGTEAGGGIFAPTLRYHKGRFYMATCIIYNRKTVVSDEARVSVRIIDPKQCADARGFYVWTEDIFDEASWSDPVYFDQLGIDQDVGTPLPTFQSSTLNLQLFFDDDDRVYLSTSRWIEPYLPFPSLSAAIHTSEIDISTGRSLTNPVILRESPTRCAKGPHIYKIKGWYYLMTAEGGTAESSSVCIYRSKSVFGPYENGPNPIVCNRLHPTVRNTNHADIVQDKQGNWIIFFIACRLQAHGGMPLGRETFRSTMTFDDDGWPVVNDGRDVELTNPNPALAPQHTAKSWREDFVSSKLYNNATSRRPRADLPAKGLSLGWYRLRTPVKCDHSLTERPGWLALRGNAWTLRDLEAPALLLRKQYCPMGTWSTLIDFEPTTSNVEAGITIYWSLYAYGAILIRRGDTPGSRTVILRWTDEKAEEPKVSNNDSRQNRSSAC